MAEAKPEISMNRASKGLAVIITNDYADSRKYDTLGGTFKDGERLKGAFEALEFDVRWKHNVNLPDIQRLWLEIKSFNFELVKHYKCIAFVFSGHGEPEGSSGKLIMQDGAKIDICNDFISPVLPGSARKIGDIPKIFFIDACRGSKETETVDVPKHTTGKGSPSNSGSAEVRKGCHNIDQWKLPKEGNFLAAYSTLPGCKSVEFYEKGSLWLGTLARLLPDNRASIDDILSDVNEELHKIYRDRNYEFQQPERLSRLNRRLFLMDVSERDERRLQTTREQMKLDQPEMKTPTVVPTQQVPMDQRESEASWSADQTPLDLPLNQTPSAQPTSNRVVTRPKGSGRYCARLKEYTKPKFDYIADHSSGSTRHRCTISYFKDGSTKYMDSGYYTSRASAEEQAAKKILSKENWPLP